MSVGGEVESRKGTYIKVELNETTLRYAGGRALQRLSCPIFFHGSSTVWTPSKMNLSITFGRGKVNAQV